MCACRYLYALLSLQVLKHKFFQINSNLSSVPTHPPIAPSVSKPQISTSNNYSNTLKDFPAANNRDSSDTVHSKPVVNKPRRSIISISENLNEPQFSSDKRETSSNDSGVHFDSDTQQCISSSNAPVVPRHKDTPVSRHKDTPTSRFRDTPTSRFRDTPTTRYRDTSVDKRRTEYNPVVGTTSKYSGMLPDIGASRRGILPEIGASGRRQWNEEQPAGYLSRPPREMGGMRDNWLEERPTIPRDSSRVFRINKKEAAQFYLSSSRYSPLTSGKKTGESHSKVAFGSSAPRFTDSQLNNRQYNSPTLHSRSPYGPGLKGMRISAVSKDLSFPVDSHTRQNKVLPSWLKTTKVQAGASSIACMYVYHIKCEPCLSLEGERRRGAEEGGGGGEWRRGEIL